MYVLSVHKDTNQHSKLPVGACFDLMFVCHQCHDRCKPMMLTYVAFLASTFSELHLEGGKQILQLSLGEVGLCTL